MRILQIVNSLTHTSIPIEIACEMRRREEVEIAALYNTQEEADRFAEELGIGCRIHGFGYRKDKLGGLRSYVRFLKGSSYDILHTHHALSGTLARLYCYGKRGKLVHTVHANYHSYSRAQNLLIGSTMGRSDAVVFNSRSSRDGLYEWEKRKIRRVRQEVIYNGVNVSRIRNAPDGFWRSFCADNGIGVNDLVITQIGRLEPVKNPLGSLNAFLRMKELTDAGTWERLRLVYMGSGSEQEKMKQFAARNGLERKVLMPGVIARDDVYSWMRRADLLIIPSFFEGFCNTLAEGMIAGNEICIADIPVFREIIPQELDLPRFDPGDPDSAARVMAGAITAEDKGRDARAEYAEKHYSLDHTVENYLALYGSLG